MNRLLALALALMSVTGLAQLPDGSVAPDFVATDINGSEHHLYSYLDSGYQVVLLFETTWNSPGWSYHTSETLRTLHEEYGPDGTDEIRVLMLESDSQTTLEDLAGTGANTQGDWITGTPYPIIDDAESIFDAFECNYYPTIFTICPNRLLKESDQASVADHAAIFQAPECAAPSLPQDASLIGFHGETWACGSTPYLIEVSLMNTGIDPLTSCVIAAYNGATEVGSIDWSGHLETFESEIVVVASPFLEESTEFQVSIISEDGDASNNSVSSGLIQTATQTIGTLRFSLLTDTYPSETSWSLSNQNAEIVAGADEFNAVTTHNYDLDLQQGCHVLRVFDTYGDGLNVTYYDGVGPDGSFDLMSLVDGTPCQTLASYSAPDFFSVWEFPFEVVPFEALPEDPAVCDIATPETSVTFTVDMATTPLNSSGVHLAGSFQGWDPASTPMNDNGDGTWSVSLNLAPGNYEFKFINSNAWDGNEEFMSGTACSSGDNRIAFFDESNNTYTSCFNQCPGEACGAPVEGCTDANASNYNPEADLDNGSCMGVNWTCGAPWMHQGYEYETVQIGDQCWFAENLRSEQYANGDDLLHAGPDSLWAGANQTSSGAWCHPDGEPENSMAYGHLYNHWVAMDERGVCPTGWNVPTDEDYIQLEMHAGMPLEVALEEDVRGTDEGLKLKAAEGQFEGWQGTDAYGFSWVPGGWRHVGGSYGGTHALGLHLFTPSEESNGAPYGFRQVDGTQTQVGRYFVGNMGDGRSIRCLLASSCSADNDIQGCTDPDALNFNPEATADDASCTYTPEVPECASVCGPGTYWDMEQSLCLPTLSADLDLSGCVGMSDLLEMLAQFGTCFVPEWSCGDDLNYHGYDYHTVMVAGDCWFAENLKSENYRNGDPIPTLEGEEAWFYTEEGAQGVYANGQVPCIHFCNSNELDDLFGRVYNWFAVDDNRGLCPSGWHVSQESEWANLFSYVEGLVGDSVSFALKATSTWYEIDGIPGAGTDDFGMSIMPTGQRAVKLHGNGNLAIDANAGYQGSYWTSDSHSAEFGRDVYFHHWYLDPNISYLEKEYAVSVRCVLD